MDTLSGKTTFVIIILLGGGAHVSESPKDLVNIVVTAPVTATAVAGILSLSPRSVIASTSLTGRLHLHVPFAVHDDPPPEQSNKESAPEYESPN